MARIDPPFVTVWFTPRIGSDSLTTVDNLSPSGVESSLTESGAEPGLAEPADEASPWRPGIVGTQTAALTVTAVRGGFPGRRGAGLLYRLAEDTALTDYRGWSPPNLITGWTSPPSTWASADAWTRLTICADPDTGILVAIGQSSATSDANTWSYNPRTNLWTDRYDWGANEGLTASTFPTLVPDPDVRGRILLFAGKIGYYTDDFGATWMLRTKDSIDAGNISLDVAVAPGVDWLAAGMSSDGNLYASSDRGASWETTESVASLVSANSVRVVRVDGVYVVTYRRTGDNQPCCRRLSHARASFADADEIVIDATTSRDVTSAHPVVDEDGTVYVFARDLALTDLVRCYASRDAGLTWSRFRWGVWAADSDPDYLVPQALCASNGSIFVFATGSVISDVHLVRLGGWSTCESGTSQPDFAGSAIERIGYGYYDGTSTGDFGGCYLPADQPTDVGWTSVGVDGTAVVTSAGNPGLVITTAAAQTRSYARSMGGSFETNAGEAYVRDVTQSVAGVVFVSLELTNTVYSYRTQIRIGTGGITVVDADAGTTLGTLVDSMHATGWHVRWHATQGTVTVLARSPVSTEWQIVCSDATVTDGTPVAGDDTIAFGHRNTGSGADVSHWYLVASSAGGSFLHGLTANGYPDPGVETAPLEYGGPMPSAASGGYPIPDATEHSENLGRISAAGGPVAVADVVELPVEYRHGIHHIHPAESPTPADYWEADIDNNTVLVYDLGNATWVGGAICVVALHATLRTVQVRSGTNSDGSTGWVTLGTMDLSLGEVTFDRVGDMLSPATGTLVIDRYFHEDELVGGWMPIPGATLTYRKIAANSPGYWTDASGVQQVRIRLDGIDGTEDTTGDADIYHHSAICILYPSADTPRRYYKLTAEAIDTDDGHVPSAGILTVGRVTGVGSAPGWSWTRRTEPSATIARAGDGTVSSREDGPPREIWTYQWTDGLPWQNWRLTASPGNYVAISGGAPIGTISDAYELQAMLEHATQSGQIPMVVVPKPPTTSGVTITDPTRYLYGIPVAEAAILTGVVGDEGVNEINRYDGITVESLGGRTPRRSS